MNLLFITKDISRSRYGQSLCLLPMSLTRTSILCRKFRLVNIGLQRLQWLICTVIMKVQVNYKSVANSEGTKCDALEFVNVHFWPDKLNTTKKNYMKEKYLKRCYILTRHMFFAYYYIFWTPGRLYHIKFK